MVPQVMLSILIGMISLVPQHACVPEADAEIFLDEAGNLILNSTFGKSVIVGGVNLTAVLSEFAGMSARISALEAGAPHQPSSAVVATTAQAASTTSITTSTRTTTSITTTTTTTSTTSTTTTTIAPIFQQLMTDTRVTFGTIEIGLTKYSKPTGFLFSNLTTVDSVLNVYSNVNLTSLEFLVLNSVGASVYIQNNVNLKEISFPNLTRVGGDLRIINNTKLESISFPSLTSIGSDLYITTNPHLTSISFPNLATVTTRFYIQYNNVLTSMSFLKLTTIYSATPSSSSTTVITICANPLLEYIDFRITSTPKKGCRVICTLCSSCSIPCE